MPKKAAMAPVAPMSQMSQMSSRVKPAFDGNASGYPPHSQQRRGGRMLLPGLTGAYGYLH
ncbi:hypothetical protein MKP05_03460 [Halomonas sp. EGI 63088]|uniref:Uncharacterized protein n=1 Tax=Halomonas flagellata TaxID=2920385 RepID=A0ABS9RQS6_9GAMM|nr:hypothetical protein [Halomonas flagellata]MCH4562186.1 hypothetical protein [Halomonas flagellata]